VAPFQQGAIVRIGAVVDAGEIASFGVWRMPAGGGGQKASPALDLTVASSRGVGGPDGA
jgi:hypothetical protein